MGATASVAWTQTGPRRSPLTWLVPAVLAAVAGLGVLAGRETALYAAAGVLLFYAFLRAPILGLYLTTASLLLSGADVLDPAAATGVRITGPKVIGAAAFVAWAFHWLAQRRSLRLNVKVYALGAFLLWTLVGIALARERAGPLTEWLRLVTVFGFFIMALNLLDTRERLHRFVMIILLCGMIVSGYGLAQYFIEGVKGAYLDPDSLAGEAALRISGTAGHSNWMALIVLTILPLNVYWLYTAKRLPVKAVAFTAILVECYALVLTFTRTGFLVGVVVAAALVARRMIRVTIYRFIILVVAVAAVWFMLDPAYKERVLTPSQYVGSSSVQHRMELQKTALRFFAEEPIWGIGLGRFGERMIDSRLPYEVVGIMEWRAEALGENPLYFGVHNMYLQLACETGVVGLVLMLSFFVMLYRDLNRATARLTEAGDWQARALSITLEVSLISFLLCAFFLHALQQKIWWILAVLAVSVPLYQLGAAESAQKGAAPPEPARPHGS